MTGQRLPVEPFGSVVAWNIVSFSHCLPDSHAHGGQSVVVFGSGGWSFLGCAEFFIVVHRDCLIVIDCAREVGVVSGLVMFDVWLGVIPENGRCTTGCKIYQTPFTQLAQLGWMLSVKLPLEQWHTIELGE